MTPKLSEEFETKVGGNLALGGAVSSGRRTLPIMSRVSSRRETASGNSEGKGDDDEDTDADEEIGPAGFTSRNVIPDDVAE